MKIECPKCKAFLNVDESKIPEKGVYGKCPKCQERILVKRGVGLQKLDLESELKETIEHEKEIERDTRIKKAVPVAEEKPAINDRKVRSFGSILLYGGIFLLIAVPVFFSVFNSFVQKREYQKAQDIRQQEIRKNIDIFTADSEGILKHLENLIDHGKTTLAEKEINKFDIPVLTQAYPEISLLKKRIYAEKIRNEHGTKAHSIYKLTYDWAYKGGVAAGRYDKNNDYSYSPEDTSKLPPMQMMLMKLKENAGYSYNDEIELGFNDGYTDGYKEGYY